MSTKKNYGLLHGHRQNKEQERLRKNYGIKNENVVVVERKSKLVLIWKTTLHFLFILLRILSAATVITLAVIGLTSLIFPDTRAALIETFLTSIQQIRQFLNL